VHFLGGVFVSPAPQLAYRYLLESLCSRGFLVVATPFAVDFDYRKPAADIYARFNGAKAALTDEYGPLPQLAMGHSLGALMQVMLSCTYNDYARDCQGSALLSFNNKPVSDAIPLFEQLFVPALAPLAPVVRGAPYTGVIATVAAVRRGSFALARQTNALALNPLVLLSSAVGLRALEEASRAADEALRDAEAVAALADQIPDVLGSIAGGTSEFSPSPVEMRELIASRYIARSPLVVQFSIDSLDESPALLEALPATAAARSLRLTGTHLTPLAQAVAPTRPSSPASLLPPLPVPLPPLPLPLPPLPGLGGGREAQVAPLMADVDQLVEELVTYFDRSVASPAAAPPAPASKGDRGPGGTEVAAVMAKADARVAEARVAEARAVEAKLRSARVTAAAQAEAAAGGAVRMAASPPATAMAAAADAGGMMDSLDEGSEGALADGPPPTWKYDEWVPDAAAAASTPPLSGASMSVGEAVAAEAQAKGVLARATEQTVMAQQQALVAKTQVLAGRVAPTTPRPGARFAQLRAAAEARAAAAAARSAEEEAEWEAREAAVVSRIAEIEALADAAREQRQQSRGQ